MSNHDAKPIPRSETRLFSTPDDTPATSVKHEHFLPKYTARPATAKSARRSQPTAILGSIDEHGGMNPDIPLRTPSTRKINFSFVSLFPGPTLASTKPPPPEDPYDAVKGPHGEKFTDVRLNKPQSERNGRGGWRTLICLGCVLVTIIAAVAIGVVIGLTRRKGHSSSNDKPLLKNETSVTGFPVGTWTLTTFLASVNTNCTPNSATWRCYPYQTYNQSQTGSQTMLTWIITGETDGSSTNYSISSDQNPFALPFNSAALRLVNRRTPDESWSFNVTTQKIVVPNAALTSDGSTTQCFYNSTVLSGNLYTRRAKSYPTEGNGGESGSWPYAVEVVQTATAGQGVPDCYKTMNGNIGERVTVSGNVESGAECACEYMNYGT